MRREALRIFESQRGAGQIPYQMLPYQQGLGSMPRANVSPAFQYAAQNYQRLGGAQRLMDRPMEMMSVAERQRINEMAQGMADSQSRRRLGRLRMQTWSKLCVVRAVETQQFHLVKGQHLFPEKVEIGSSQKPLTAFFPL
jgi:hypothetical protein